MDPPPGVAEDERNALESRARETEERVQRSISSVGHITDLSRLVFRKPRSK
jgi:hypothetical protein